MDKKLTDTEIKKALGRMSCKTLDDCNLINDTLDLINRQEEEKTELLGKIEELEANRVELLENIEQLESVITQIKAEAYKECIEKVKEKSKKTEVVASGALIAISYAISAKNLDNLLNELVGDGDGK